MSGREQIFLFGASGHAKVVIDMVEKQGLYDIKLLLDDDPALAGSTVYGYPVAGGKSVLLSGDVRKGIVTIGSNRARAIVASWLMDNHYELVSVIHPSAQIARGVEIGPGSVVMAGACINAGSHIGRNVIVNTNSNIDHDCFISDDVHIAPGAVLCGSVTVGKGTFVCAGTTIIPNLVIGSYAVIGAGSTVITHVADNATVVGSPARVVQTPDRK